MTLERALEILREEFDGFDDGVEKITVPNTEGPDSVVGVKMSNGAWYILRAAIVHVLEAADNNQPPPDSAKGKGE